MTRCANGTKKGGKIVKSERTDHDERNESESDVRETECRPKVTVRVERTNFFCFMTDFYRRPTTVLAATIVKARMVVQLLL